MSSLYKKNKKFYLLLILPALLLYSFAMLAPLFGGTIPYSFLKWNLMSGKKAFVGFYIIVKSHKSFFPGHQIPEMESDVREKSFCGI